MSDKLLEVKNLSVEYDTEIPPSTPSMVWTWI